MPAPRTFWRSSTTTSTIPRSSPYAYSNVPGFTGHMDTGSQVGSINNVQTIGSTLSISETVGVLREKAYATNDQPLTPDRRERQPQDFAPSAIISPASPSTTPSAISTTRSNGAAVWPTSLPSLSIGPDAEYQGANTGMFQNRIMPSGTAIWSKGRHSLSFGGSWSYTQLNLRDRRTGTGSVASPDFVSFLDNWVTPYTTQNFTATTYLQGNANRYYRANETGLFVQDKFQVTPNLSITAGVRYDWNGGLTEKNGNIFNFNPVAIQLRHASDPTPFTSFRLHHRRQQRERNLGREQDHAHRPPVGHCAARRLCLAAVQPSTPSSWCAAAAASTTTAANCSPISRRVMRPAKSTAAHSALCRHLPS